MNTAEKKESFVGQCNSFLSEMWDKTLLFLSENAIIIALLLLYIFFYRLWESLIGDFLIDRFFCHFESNRVSDSLFIAGVLFGCFLCYHKRKRRIKPKTLFLCLIAIAFWAFYRFFHRVCGLDPASYYLNLKSLSFTEHIKYFDIIPLVAFCILASPLLGKLIAHFKEKNKNGEENGNNEIDGFIRDYPIDGSNDLLGRKELAHHLMARLLATDTTDGSFTLGIDAPWGSGKTSFLNMMREQVDSEDKNKQKTENDNVAIIEFNPWLYAGDKVSVLMGYLSRNLRRYDVSLAKNLLDYSRLISSFDKDDVSYLASLIDFAHNDRTLKKKKQQIRDSIMRIPKKIVVFVDDLDGLDAKGIIEVMKLIRYISDFPNMYFVVAYDKNHLIQCLNTIIPAKGADFIDKVIQHEFHLPAAPDAMTSCVLKDYLYPTLTETDQIALSSFLDEEHHLPPLSNLREAKRLVNSFTSNYLANKPSSKNQIICLYLLELFKIKYPLAFSFFESHWERMIIEKKSEDEQKAYNALYDEPSNGANINFFEYMQDKENRKNLNINIADKSIIESILSLLFGKNGYLDRVDSLRHYFNPSIS